MKALQIIQPRDLRVVETEKPECQAGEVLLRVRYVGFCGSDLNTYRGLNPMVRMPVIPGHEIGAEIVSKGSSVPAFLKEGSIVTVNPYTNCGVCPSCRHRRYNACEHNETLGVQRNGAMCEYISVPWQKVIPVEGINVRDCALIEPMSVGFHAVSRAEVTDNDYVVVIGCGMVGIGAIVRSVRRGATVIACDIDDAKLSIVKQMGAQYTVNTMKEDVHSRLSEITHGGMPDVVIEAVGSPATYQMAVSEVAFTGRVVCIGYAKQDVSFATKLFVQKELDIRGSRNALPEDFQAVVRYLQTSSCPYEVLESEVVGMEEAHEAMKRWDAAPGKVFRILVSFG